MVDIVHRVGIRASAQDVYTTLATPEGVARWWTQDTIGGREVGQHQRMRFLNHGVEIGSMEMKLLELRPSELVLWQVTDGPPEWKGTLIRYDLKREEDYTIVLFSHKNWAERVEFMHHCSTKWALFLMSLKSLLETGTGQPSPHDVKIDNWN